MTCFMPKLFAEHAFRTVYHMYVYDVTPMIQLCASNMAAYVNDAIVIPYVYRLPVKTFLLLRA